MRLETRIVEALGQEPGLIDTLPVMLANMLADYMSAPASELAVVLAAAQALQHVHHTHHWQTRGQAAYGDHLLFQRLYEALGDEVDGLGEKAVGLGGVVLVQPLLRADHALTFLKCVYVGTAVVPKPEDLVALSLRAELCFMQVLQCAYKLLEAKDSLTLGVDNQLQGIFDKHETHVYLLQQRLGRQASLAARVARRSQ